VIVQALIMLGAGVLVGFGVGMVTYFLQR